jgi:hypothetical protein
MQAKNHEVNKQIIFHQYISEVISKILLHLHKIGDPFQSPGLKRVSTSYHLQNLANSADTYDKTATLRARLT